MKRHPIKQKNQDAFLEAFAVHSNVYKASEASGISITYHKRWLRSDRQYLKSWIKAVEDARNRLGADYEETFNWKPKKKRKRKKKDPNAISLRESTTLRNKNLVLAAYSECGNITEACEFVGVSTQSVRNWQRSDTVFAEKLNTDAAEGFRDSIRKRLCDLAFGKLTRINKFGQPEPIVDTRTILALANAHLEEFKQANQPVVAIQNNHILNNERDPEETAKLVQEFLRQHGGEDEPVAPPLEIEGQCENIQVSEPQLQDHHDDDDNQDDQDRH